MKYGDFLDVVLPVKRFLILINRKIRRNAVILSYAKNPSIQSVAMELPLFDRDTKIFRVAQDDTSLLFCTSCSPKKSKSFLHVLIAFSLTILLAACHEETPPPPNPFDSIDYTVPTVEVPQPDSNSLVGLHTYIFSQSCAVPGCHDGSFEPDFRTVQSTYSTLVYQPVIKNDLAGSYEFRVKPGDYQASWLYNRVTTDDQTLGRMPLYDNPLTSGQLKALREWIEAGAPDMFGNPSAYPNTQPAFAGMVAFIDFGGLDYRVDTIRGNNNFNPFGTLKNQKMTIWMAMNDDSTNVKDLTDTKILFSSDPDDFSSAIELDAVYSSSPKVIPNWYGTGNDVVFNWKVELQTNNFPAGEITYFRFYTDDGNHSELFEFPAKQNPPEFKFFMSFYIVP